MAETGVVVTNQATGVDVSTVEFKTINGNATTKRRAERVIVSRSIGVDGAGDDILNDLDIGTPNVATTKVNCDVTVPGSQLLPPRANRRSLKIVNDSTLDLIILFDVAANIGVDNWAWKIFAGEMYEMPTPVHTGEVSGLWLDPLSAGANGKARITEQW